MSVQKRTLCDFCASRDPFSLSGLRAGLREGAAISRGDLTVDLQLAVVVEKTKFPELTHEKVDVAASARHQFRRQPVTAMLHDGGNLFRSLRFAGF
jgi:hypothetical protein